MKEINYNRTFAVAYAKTWAMKRNPNYYDFEQIGGDCTNFASQCLFAGCKTMNFTQTYGWYYRSVSDRAPAWTGVEFLYNFLTTNKSLGPRASVTKIENILPGDLIQLGDNTRFYHTLIVTQVRPNILICAHSYDAYNKPLEDYKFESVRCLHVSNSITARG